MDSLPTRRLGRDGPMVTAIGYGAMGLSTMYHPRPADAERLGVLDAVFDMGIRHWDTADCYEDNEALLGRWFRRTGKRDGIFLASKFAVTPTGEVRNDAKYVREACNRSLQVLGVDHIDLYYCHRMDRVTPIEETVRAMAQLKDEGKIRYLGLSECSAQTLRRA